MMIEQLIKKYINKHYQILSEALHNDEIIIDAKESGWKLVIPSSQSIRGQKANQLAKSNNAETGLMVIARKPKDKTIQTNDSKLISDVKKLFTEAYKQTIQNIGMSYDEKTTLFIYLQVLDKPNKKVWNIWAVDKNSSGINSAIEQLKQQPSQYKQSDLTKTIVSADKIDKINTITFMSYDMAKNWFTLLETTNVPLQLPNLDYIKRVGDISDSDDENNLKSSQEVWLINSEPQNRNIYNVYRTKDQNGISIGTMELTDDNLLYKNVKLTLLGFFQGIALMTINETGTDYDFIPLEGTFEGTREKNNKLYDVKFYGEFKNGLPYNGEVKIIPEYSKNTIDIFTGIVGMSNLTKLNLLKGKMRYSDGLLFDGEFKNFEPLNGIVYNKQNQIIGKYVNGNRMSATSLKYPYKWDSIDYGLITVYKQGKDVYVPITLELWGKTTQNNFELKNVNGSVTKIFDMVSDKEIVTKLNKDLLKITPDEVKDIDSNKSQRKKLNSSKKKYVVFTSNKANIYTFNGTEFELWLANSSTNAKDRSTGYPYLGVKTAKIKNRDERSYKMYKIKVLVDKVYVEYYIPESYVKIVER